MKTNNTRLRWQPIVMTLAALMLVLSVGVWGMIRDMRQVGDSITNSRISNFRSHAERTVSRLELEMGSVSSISSFKRDHPTWFDRLWLLTVKRMPELVYGAIFSSDLEPLAQSSSLKRPSEAGETAGQEYLVPDLARGEHIARYGPGTIFIPASPETLGKNIIDFNYPIKSGQQIVGYYRSGLDYDQLEADINFTFRRTAIGWIAVLSSIAIIVFGACISLYKLGTHTAGLEVQLGNAEKRRIDELHRLMLGLAHEIRNPLNAIRLNLFASKKLISNHQKHNLEDAANMLDESADEIERMNALVGQLLGYARVVSKQPSVINVDEMASGVADFLTNEMNQSNAKLTVQKSENAAMIMMDANSFRQVLINLVRNANQALGVTGGEIQIEIASTEDGVSVSVHDSGPGIDESILEQIFEPFFTTRDNGVGMGLAVVKGLVEIAGGRIAAKKSRLLAGAQFQITFPAPSSSSRA